MASIYTTKPVEEDGYLEIHLSLSPTLPPLMRCRAVFCDDGRYIAVVRDYSTGVLISESIGKFYNTQDALTYAISSALDFLKECIN